MIRRITRIALSIFYAAAGILHLALPEPFIGIVPPWVPLPSIVVFATGLSELAGAAGMAQPFLTPIRRAAGWGLAAYALCVWPANVQHMMLDMSRPNHGLGLGYHIPRLLLQPVLIWLPLWAAGVVNGPQRR